MRILAHLTNLLRLLDRRTPYLVALAAVMAYTETKIFHWYPPVGTYVVFLGLAAVLITFRATPMRPSEKSAWIIFAVVMAYLEISNLYRDRDEHDKSQRKYDAEQRSEYTKNRRADNDVS